MFWELGPLPIRLDVPYWTSATLFSCHWYGWVAPEPVLGSATRDADVVCEGSA